MKKTAIKRSFSFCRLMTFNKLNEIISKSYEEKHRIKKNTYVIT